jgi:DNA polymerase-3 subunit gamma/tau
MQESLKKQARATNLDTVLAGLDVLTAAKARTRGSPHVATLLEMAVIRLARLEELVSVAGLLAGGAAPAYPNVPPDNASKKNSLAASPVVTAAPEAALDLTDPQAIAEFVKSALGPMKGNQIGQAGVPAISGPNALAFRFAKGYSSAYEACADERTVSLIQAALKKASGRDWIVRMEVDATAKGPEAKPLPAVSTPNRQKDLLALPLFAKVTNTFGAQLVKLDDGFQPVAVGGAEDSNEE